MIESKTILETTVKAADGKRAENIIALDMENVSLLADYFVIMSADSKRQVAAIADEIIDQNEKSGVTIRHVEGQRASEWILVDLGDVVVNIFQTDQRKFYNLEKLWSEAKVVDVKDWVEA
ncbi:ribosome silencing factor [Pediococcus ethanolidurans]|uniref:Ribosomal silencing factor RsfS n=1 Tax=Pediococcus ethanolidurans TaxID=319653 RepID=A0A1H9QBN0_9LACO|nr:ribosome silencing factor [Pediococcus ethanolidurans]MBU7554743.1 ribosome silencing factor [Pediococcus ethanolidurans]MBU7562739.1 ribosome silencing factor [Pediococcus ethanolidurans]MCV3314377.1 ribosome silencing factor [Pediococcus ethanolidurans]MCV3320658.1 ribosome silencing factor [Pediococcus ethanolidurans]MCV3322858.1 ribosome silencing factor [Pediococcus ethanolidurans]